MFYQKKFAVVAFWDAVHGKYGEWEMGAQQPNVIIVTGQMSRIGDSIFLYPIRKARNGLSQGAISIHSSQIIAIKEYDFPQEVLDAIDCAITHEEMCLRNAHNKSVDAFTGCKNENT